MARTTTLDGDIEVDRGIAEVVQRVRDAGYTTRYSCSGLDCDHPDASYSKDAYLVIQAAPTFDGMWRPDDRLPDGICEQTLVEALLDLDVPLDLDVSWWMAPTVTDNVYPSVLFTLNPGIKTCLFALEGKTEYRGLDPYVLRRVEDRQLEVQARYKELSDADIRHAWEQLVEQLEALADGRPLPTYEDGADVTNSVDHARRWRAADVVPWLEARPYRHGY